MGSPEFEAVASPPATDSEFLRRVTLDLVGQIPTPAEAKAFLDDPSSDKRTRKIDELLADPRHARRMQWKFDRMLMEGRRGRRIRRSDWRAYLFRSFRENKPWDEMAREILSADGSDPDTRAATTFYLDRDAEANQMVRDIGRLFLGRDMQCAQCHDHPLVGDYSQADYYGLYAYLQGSFVFTDKKKAYLAEKVTGEAQYASVFFPDSKEKTGPRLLGLPPVEAPTFPKGKEYYVEPSSGLMPVPKFSRRERLARDMVDPRNRAFQWNIVNRLWAMMMGRGLFEPLDMYHSENPPSNPKLLDMLAEDFAANGFDMKWFLRELALTETYQRSSEMPAGVEEAPPDRFTTAVMKPLSPEQLGWALMQATGLVDVQLAAVDAALKKSDPKFYPFLRDNPTWKEKALYEKLDGNLRSFVSLFAPPAGVGVGPYQATVEQALFLRNGSVIESWLKPRAGNLVDRLSKLSDADEVAEELYLQVLSRRPNLAERAETRQYLEQSGDDRPEAVTELAWALMASAEFRFNH